MHFKLTTILLLIAILILLIKPLNILKENSTTYDYQLEITPDSIYIIDEYDNIIHKEQVQWDNPSPLQQSLINNNQ